MGGGVFRDQGLVFRLRAYGCQLLAEGFCFEGAALSGTERQYSGPHDDDERATVRTFMTL